MIVLKPSIEVNIPLLTWLEPECEMPVTADLTHQHVPPCSHPGLSQQNMSTFGDAINLWRRKSGIPRPNSAGRASITAAIACRAMVEAGKWNSARLAIVTASTSSATAVAVNFETRGLSEGWNAVDPLLLPSTLPSALATQLAMAVGANGFALSCNTGLLGTFHAIEAAIAGLTRGDCDIALVVASEEQTDVQRSSHEVLGWLPTPGEIAGVLSLERDTHRGFRIGFLSYGNSVDAPIPEGWQGVAQYSVRAPHTGPSMQNGNALRGIIAALLSPHERVIVTGCVPGLGSSGVGFERA